jgi:hypothetical protein
MKVLMLFVLLLSLVGCGNPSVESGYVAYCTHTPMLFGKASFEGVLKGPTSYGLSWRVYCDKQEQMSVNKITESFLDEDSKGGTDLRILSTDNYNMEVNISIVLGFKHSGINGVGYDESQFQAATRTYFEQYYYNSDTDGNNMKKAWTNNFSTEFRSDSRVLIAKEDYKSAKANREKIAKKLFEKWTGKLDKTPFHLYSVSINTINPPKRILNEEEASKAVEIAEERQEREIRLKTKQGEVIKKEAENLKMALKTSPKYLEWKELELKKLYAEGFETMSKGKSLQNVQKVLVVPYGTPHSVNTN